MEVEQIIKLMEAVAKNGLTEFSYEEDGTVLKLKKSNGKVQQVQPQYIMMGNQTPQASAMPVAVPAGNVPAAVETQDTQAAGEDTVPEGNIVSCPLVGTFYSASAPDAEPFVQVGDTVKKGQVLGIVEAMKLMNEIESEYDGVVKAILVKNGDLVEYGQDMFVIG